MQLDARPGPEPSGLLLRFDRLQQDREEDHGPCPRDPSKPVVAFDVGGIPDWLENNQNGFLVPRKDTHAMARAIERCLDDKELAHQLGSTGKRFVEERFGRDSHVDQLERLLLSACP